MSKYYEMLQKDIRFIEGMNSCMNCGICTGVCPAAEFYNYDPRQIVAIVQSKDDKEIEKILKENTIWYCGECMSCKPRCPRGNVPALIVQALRMLSQKLGFFTHSEKGRQQLALKRTVGNAILNVGYCVTPDMVNPDMHPEQGINWTWIRNNVKDVFARFDNDYAKLEGGAMRKMDEETMKEIHAIFEVTGGLELHDTIERFSEQYARENGFESADDNYMRHLITFNSHTHYE